MMKYHKSELKTLEPARTQSVTLPTFNPTPTMTGPTSPRSIMQSGFDGSTPRADTSVPGVRVRRAQPAAEHAHDLCFSASEFGSFPPRGLTRTRTSRGWMSRHGTRLVNGLKATPRRGAPLPRATIYGDVASVGSVGTARTGRARAPRPPPPSLSAGACLRTPGNPCARIRYSTYALAT
jgi:hypothetical protein